MLGASKQSGKVRMARVIQFLIVAMLGAFFLSQAECRFPLAPGADQRATSGERVYKMSCQIESFAQSGDGKWIWVAGEDRLPSGPPPIHRPWSSRVETIYAVDLNSAKITKVITAPPGFVTLVASPIGARIVLVLPKERSNGRAILYDRTHQIAELPIDPWLVVWSADGSRIYFYGGTTIEAEEWNILGLLRLSDLAVSRITLLEPTESVHVCGSTGQVFTGDTIPNNAGELVTNTVEYDSDIRRPRRIRKFPAGYFSAHCKYVATEDSLHGPLPWKIVDVSTGQRLMQFDFMGEGKENEFEFVSWNPKRDNILLRRFYPARNAEKAGQPPTLQVFDVEERRVLKSFPNVDGQVEWSKRGTELILPRGKSLVFPPVFEETLWSSAKPDRSP